MGSGSRRLLNQIHPLEGCELDGLEGAPRSPSMDDLSFVEAVDRLGQRAVVVRVADAADGGLDPGFGETLGCMLIETYWAIFAITMMDEAAGVVGRLSRSWSACSRASRTKSACAVLLARQPTIRRA